MGSHMKKSIFEEQTAKAIKKWQKAAKERKKLRNKTGPGADVSSGFMTSPENTPSRGSSPMQLLHKYKHNSTDLESGISSPRAYHSETELSEIEGAPPSIDDHEPRRQNNPKRLLESHSADFSFAMP